MSKLKYDQTGERRYETGVSNLAVFVWDKTKGKYGIGNAWNGVTAVSEAPEGGEDNYIYADNIKYLNLKSPEEWKGSITAYDCPKAFDACDGILEIDDGIVFGQQDRSSFAICFLSRLGNDVDGDKYGQKLTIVYGLTATPTSKDHNTVNDSPEAQEFSWDINSLPVVVDGYNAFSTITVKSTECSKEKWTQIINTLYGSDAAEAVYKLTTDTSIVQGKKYYTRTGSEGAYVYTEVTSPIESELNLYYELVSPATEDKEPTLMMPDDFLRLAGKIA